MQPETSLSQTRRSRGDCNDIENRISELFAEKLSAGSQVITIADVEEVIARMGKPEDFGEDTEEEEPKRQPDKRGTARCDHSAQIIS